MRTLWQAGIWVALGWALGATTASAQALPPEVTEALARAGVPESSVAMVVAPLPPPPGTVSHQPEPVNASGEGNPTAAPQALPAPRLAWRADAAMNPASVMKLVTTYAGLDLLGPGYFWKTRVYTSGYVKGGVLHGKLLIQGSGDPKLVRERLAELIEAIRAKGITAIDGDIVLDRSVFKLPPHDPAAFDDDPLRPYNAGPDGLLVNFKSLVFHFSPEPRRRQARVEVEPPIAGVDLPATVPTAGGACGDWKTRLALDFSNPGAPRFKGRYPARCGAQSWAVAYPEPDGYAPRVIEAMWRAAGGALSGQVRWQQQPARGQPLVTGLSLPLGEIVHDINLYSNNVMAQQLFLTLSAAGDGRGSFAESTNTLKRWWRERFGLRAAPIIGNGSGLSREGRITAAALVALLQQAAAGPHAEVFERSLPIAGVSGTLRRLAARSPGSEAIGNARLKTGSLRDVAAIAGYAWGRSGQVYAVVGLVNDPNADAARPALDRLVEWAVRDQ
ncbi:MAG: D-alanyl-D-alanine carboxypeptidase/D-alanyl-D-alanine-endopeptidase [Burkholderiaceae bacterium]|nr:D-alanyl-D-alanine carboxypeptidase/D-alanyl-D-alanine-endopeptidase [Pseudomonadota bacterium]MBS0595760.1 D-alanyl-D-alanine carboxypeptidase/D-alanyl-D-alanine-endopeptidase [Pseudomonadota bacterium]MCO5116179.1 D-alanyl-D-alanine carboxypeptidase/D-alanyl-D-alanine-endopeptidase [Burkholderiaceae bacterium]MCP5217342.1 D-alanyl-D-alanine carboxypeptidase/D-alanyl-D-alanine-endopeptidase [Burkholderiaceae bacterium]